MKPNFANLQQLNKLLIINYKLIAKEIIQLIFFHHLNRIVHQMEIKAKIKISFHFYKRFNRNNNLMIY